MYPPYAQPSISGRRGASGPTTPSMVHDQRELQRLQNEYAYPSSSSRPNTAPTVDMQKRVPVVDLTGEPDEDEDPRVAKKPRLASEPVSSAAEAMRVAGPSTPQPQRMTTNAQSFNGQVPLAANGRGYPSSVPPTWAMPHGNMPTSANEDVQMRSSVQQISQQVLTEVVQSAPPTNVQPTEAAQTLGQSEPVPSISVAMASMSVDVEHSAQATLNPSAEVVQQCIDENFVEEENEDEGEGGQERKEGSGKRWCRMCQLRYNKGLSDKAPEAFLVDATMEDLARHCQEEHPKGWVFLLQRCMEDQESDEDE
ncbi:uncharacterized protein B0H18DRAFT_290992 [Fomitopsis serialis]|uniref:uncharacterized protein n=1 Tax=Fomitopsis serialis TaxID=139415 RepID=UPI0020077057|nr:uncharacterized protein B0H18DRAFT_290992 [Neoantrodia serialis]KAH9927245.1 hypothetical protein B0H18DRAFT_290992 [Neoantrodia serialis]